jgi:hypothetical protein
MALSELQRSLKIVRKSKQRKSVQMGAGMNTESGDQAVAKAKIRPQRYPLLAESRISACPVP